MSNHQSLVDNFLRTMKLTAQSTVDNSGVDQSSMGEIIKYDKDQSKPYYIQIGSSTIQARSNGGEYELGDVVYVTRYGGSSEYIISGLKSRKQGVTTNATLEQNYDFLSGNLWDGSALDTDILKVLTTSIPKTDDNEGFVSGDTLLMTFDINENVLGVTDALVTVTIDGSANTFTIDDVQGVLTSLNNEPQIFIIKLDKTPATVTISFLSGVEITNFKLFVARESYTTKTNSLVIAPKDKYKFTTSSDGTITLTAQLRKNGLVEGLSDTSCYWFIEDPLVDSVEHENYSVYGGKGWRALNEVDTITKELIPMAAQIDITFDQVQRYNVGFKCVATDVNGVKEASNIFRIINDAAPHLEIEYDENTQVIKTALKIGENEVNYTGYIFSISGTDAYGEKLAAEDLPELIEGHNFKVDETKIGIFNTYIIEVKQGENLVDRQSVKVERQGLFGGNGTEALTLSLDNDSDIFVKTKAGEIIGAEQGKPLAVINVTAYAGSKDVTFDDNSYITLGNVTGAMIAQFIFDSNEQLAQLQITGINTSSVDSKGSIEIVWKNSNTEDTFVYATKKFTYNIITTNSDYDLILSKTVVNIDGKNATDNLSSIVVQKKLPDGTIKNLEAPDDYIQIRVNDTEWKIDNDTETWPAIKLEQFQVKDNEGNVTAIQDVEVQIVSIDTSLSNLVWDTETIEAVRNGENGGPGLQGPAGYSNATLTLFKRLASDAADSDKKPSGDLIYNFINKNFTDDTKSNLNGWSLTEPAAGTNPCYSIYAHASSNTATDTILEDEWTNPIIIEGTNGINTATVFLYKRASTVPADKPETLTYTFSTGALIGNFNNWSQLIPSSDGNPCYYIQAVAASSEATDTIDNWSDPAIYTQDGANGRGIVTTTIAYAVTDTLIDPSDISQWYSQANMPSASPEQYLWTRTVIDYDSGADTVSYTYSYQGKTGESGTSITVTAIEYQAGTSATNAPTGVWQTTIPVVSQGQYLWSKTTFSDGKSVYGVAYQSEDGDPAQDFNITASSYMLSADENGIIKPGSSITLTAHVMNLDATKVQWSADNNNWTNLGSLTYTINATGTYYAQIKDTNWKDSVVIGKIQDGATGPDGKPAISITLSNPTMTFHASTANEVEYCEVIVYEGGEKLTQAASGDGTFSIAETIDSQNKASIDNGKIKISDPTSDGSATFTVTVRPNSKATATTQDYTIYWTVVKNGDNGTSSTAAVEEYHIYYAGSTPPSLPDIPENGDEPTSFNGWQKEKPSSQTTYVWRSIAARTTTIIKDGEGNITTTYSWGAWSAPQVIEALGSNDAQTIATINNFMAVTNGGENKGIYYVDTNGDTVTELKDFNPTTDELHINADMINTGTFRVSDGNNTVFSAAAGGTAVTIGNFNVTAKSQTSGAIYSGKNSLTDTSAGVYLGTDGIALGSENINSKDITPFKVDNSGNFYAQKGQIAGWNLNPTRFISDDGQFKIQSNLANGDNNYLELGLSDALTGQFIQQFENGIQISSDYLTGFQIGVENNAVYQLEVGPNIKIQQVTITAQVVVGHDDGNNDFTVVLTPYIYDWEDSTYMILNEECSYDGDILSLDMTGNVNTEFYFKKENSDKYSNDILGILSSMDYNYNPEFITAYLEMIVEYKTNSFIIDSEGKITSPTILSLQSHIANLSGKLKPSLIINNGELIIQRNKTEIGRFSANSAKTETINIIVPTVLSDLDIDENALATTADIDALFNNPGQS